MSLARLALRNLTRRPLRTLLTFGSLVVALFLVCLLRTLVTTLESGVEAASSRRMIVQSAVSLFVDFPMSYQGKIDQVDGVARTSKWQWFGGYYQKESNVFSQFGCDPQQILDIYPELQIVEGSREKFVANRRGCVIGQGLSDDYGWKIGDTVPLIGTFFPHPNGAEQAWEFQVEAIYRPTVRNFDSRMLLFDWKYLDETMKGSQPEVTGMGAMVVECEPNANTITVQHDIDAMFANGPRVVQTTPEAEFQQQFISMMGNIPFFLTSIGGAVLAGILLASMNTMLMAAREQTRDVGVLKALGFSDARVSGLLLVQALILCGLGGGLGVGLAVLSEKPIADGMGAYFPGYHVARSTIVAGCVITLVLGLVVGLIPAWRARTLPCVRALRTTE